MDFVDIRGVPLERGDWVAFALTRGGVLATGHIVSFISKQGLLTALRVRLDSNGRETDLPYFRRKFVIMEKATPEPEPLATRALRAMRQLAAKGLHNPDCAMVREQMGLPWSEAHSVYLALEDLHESGEVRHAAYPVYAYTLTPIGKE